MKMVRRRGINKKKIDGTNDEQKKESSKKKDELDDDYMDTIKKICIEEKRKNFCVFPFSLGKILKKKERYILINVVTFIGLFLTLYIIFQNYKGNENNDYENIDNYFRNDEFIYVPNKKSSNTILLKSLPGVEIVDNTFLSAYSENIKYLRQTSLNYSLNQRLLSTECYVYFKNFIKTAISPHSLTKAIKIDNEYVYPWSSLKHEDVLNIIENANFSGYLGVWFKKYRNSQKVSHSFLKKEMPVLTPYFIQRPTAYTKFNKKDKEEFKLYGINYTWIGHSTGLVVVDGLKVLIDPVFKMEIISFKGVVRSVINWVNTKIMGGLGERLVKPPCYISQLPDDLHAVFVSHDHNDHIMEEDVKTICKLKKFQNVMWYVPEGSAKFYLREGCKPSKIYELSWGDERWISCWETNRSLVCSDGIWTNKKDENHVFRYKIIYAPTLHWTGRDHKLGDFNRSLWGSLILKGPKHRFYYSGDTAYLKDDFEEFKKIGKLHGPFHLAAIAIGAYEPNDLLRYHHIHPWESVKIWRDIRAEIAIGIHWGTFRLSAEEFLQPKYDLECALLGVSIQASRNLNLSNNQKKKQLLKKYIKNNEINEKNNLDDLKEYFYPSSDDDYNEYTESFHSIFSNNLSLFYSDIDRNIVKHMYLQEKLYTSTYNRLKRAYIIKKSHKLPKYWKKLFLSFSIRFQTIPIGGSIEVKLEGNNISMTRSSEYDSTIFEYYKFPLWYKEIEVENSSQFQNNYTYDDMINFHVVE